MGKLFDNATTIASLRDAWRRIRANGIGSSANETRDAIDRFQADAEGNIKRLQRSLRQGSFDFDPQKGVLKNKSSGGKRGLVMASVRNRIVERAWLSSLQNHNAFVKSIVDHPGSVGGVPDRSVPHGLKAIVDAFADGKTHFVRSDISSFFDNIARMSVINKLSEHIDDERFISVLEAATTVTLSNEQALGEDRRVFPTDSLGVAQGSPLSPLFGNILLHPFDEMYGNRGVVCVRFIDDFVLLANTQEKAVRAYRSGARKLSELGLHCHDPFAPKVDKEKAAHGNAADGFVFLGYSIQPGLLQPSPKARKNLLSKIDQHIRSGQTNIDAIIRTGEGGRQRYVQTQDILDKVIRGWGDAFAYGNSSDTINALDNAVDERLSRFRNWFRRRTEGQDVNTKRRAGGVALLSDIHAKSLDDLPFRLNVISARNTRRYLDIWTDGSVVVRKNSRKGHGAWAFYAAEMDTRQCGTEGETTNNRMELLAVIKAVEYSDKSRPVRIWTDSQYVASIANGAEVVRTNADLWMAFRALLAQRKIKVVWIKGHASDANNIIVDEMANKAATDYARGR